MISGSESNRERVQLRNPERMKRHLEAQAARNGVTLNAEIVSRLAESLGAAAILPGAPDLSGARGGVAERVSALEERVAKLDEMLSTGDHARRR